MKLAKLYPDADKMDKCAPDSFKEPNLGAHSIVESGHV